MLRWITTSFRPLTFIEFSKAMRIERIPGQSVEDAVMDAVGGITDLITVVETKGSKGTPSDERFDKSITLVHSSVAQYLASISPHDAELGNYRRNERGCHAMLAQFCLNYTLGTLRRKPDVALGTPRPGVDSSEGLQRNLAYFKKQGFPFMQYALSYGFRHLLESTPRDITLDLSHELFERTASLHTNWIRSQALVIGALISAADTTLCHLAALLGYTRVLQHLYDHGSSSVEILDTDGRTPLFYAAFLNRLETLEWLLDHGANPDPEDHVGQGPLHIAAVLGNADSVRRLLRAGANPLRLPTAQAKDSQSMINALCSTGLDDDFELEGTPMHIAASNHRVRNLEVLVKHAMDSGADMDIQDCRGWTPLHWAASSWQSESVEVLEILINAKLSTSTVDEDGYTALHVAISYHIEEDDATNEDDVTDMESSFRQVRMLLERCQLPVDMVTIATPKSPGGVTPLQLACEVGSRKLVEYLLNRGANPRHYDNRGRNALHWLCSQCQSGGENRSSILFTLLELCLTTTSRSET
jgi:ankyrin repeat protein